MSVCLYASVSVWKENSFFFFNFHQPISVGALVGFRPKNFTLTVTLRHDFIIKTNKKIFNFSLNFSLFFFFFVIKMFAKIFFYFYVHNFEENKCISLRKKKFFIFELHFFVCLFAQWPHELFAYKVRWIFFFHFF